MAKSTKVAGPGRDGSPNPETKRSVVRGDPSGPRGRGMSDASEKASGGRVLYYSIPNLGDDAIVIVARPDGTVLLNGVRIFREQIEPLRCMLNRVFREDV